MNILYYDCFSGISGDMNMAAMIDLGVDPHYLKAELDKLDLGAEFELKVSTCACSGIKGTQVHVCQDGKKYHDHGHAHNLAHDLAHDHDHDHAAEPSCEHAGHAEHHPAHDHAVASAARHEHHHAQLRNLAAIEAIIMSSDLKPEVKQTSLRIFDLIAKAEAKVHGKPVGEVHFHEVGATDSIVDIVGAAICFHALRVDAVWASAIELGSGLVQCAHARGNRTQARFQGHLPACPPVIFPHAGNAVQKQCRWTKHGRGMQKPVLARFRWQTAFSRHHTQRQKSPAENLAAKTRDI